MAAPGFARVTCTSNHVSVLTTRGTELQDCMTALKKALPGCKIDGPFHPGEKLALPSAPWACVIDKLSGYNDTVTDWLVCLICEYGWEVFQVQNNLDGKTYYLRPI
jgi:hypothetical protein